MLTTCIVHSMPLFEGLGGALRELRRSAPGGALTIEELARRAGLSRDAVGNWERGKASPTLDNLGSVLDVLGASAHDLARALDQAGGSDRRPDDDRSAVRAIAAILDRTPDDRRAELNRKLLEVIENFVIFRNLER